MQEQTKPKQITVQAYSFADALTELQSYVKQGYEVDVETNGTYPMLIGSLMIFSVILKEDGVVLNEAQPEVVQTEGIEQEPVQEATEPPTAVVSTEQVLTSSEITEAVVDAPKRGRTKSSV